MISPLALTPLTPLPLFVPLPETDLGQVYRGDTVSLPEWEARVFREDLAPDGIIVDLTGASVWFTAKLDLALQDSDPHTIQCTTTNGQIEVIDPTLGTYKVTIPASATQALSDDTVFVFDVQVRTDDSRTLTVKRGFFTVIRDVTRTTA